MNRIKKYNILTKIKVINLMNSITGLTTHQFNFDTCIVLIDNSFGITTNYCIVNALL